jgi:hypothetical protein
MWKETGSLCCKTKLTILNNIPVINFSSLLRQ